MTGTTTRSPLVPTLLKQYVTVTEWGSVEAIGESSCSSGQSATIDP